MVGDGVYLLEPDAGDFELERFGAAVGDHEANLGQGLPGIVGEVEAVAAAHGIHGVEGNFNLLPVAAGGEFGDVVVAGVFFGFDKEAVVFAVAFETDDGVLIIGDVDGIEVVLDGGKTAVVFEGDIAAEDEVSGGIAGESTSGASAHDDIVFDLPTAHGGRFGEVEEDFGGFGGVGLQRGESEKANEKNRQM